MPEPTAESDPLVERLAALYTPVLADVLDRLGHREHSPEPSIRPLFPEARIAGVARTVHVIDSPTVDPPNPYEGEMAAVDALRPGDVMVVSRCEWSFWGELLSTAAGYRGARGIIIDGHTRDTLAIMALKFPVFCRGIHPSDSLGRMDVDAFDVPITCGGIGVHPGDLVLADHDGIVFIPRRLSEEAILLAEEKVRGENLVRDKLAEGMPVSEAFQRYGIL